MRTRLTHVKSTQASLTPTNPSDRPARTLSSVQERYHQLRLLTACFVRIHGQACLLAFSLSIQIRNQHLHWTYPRACTPLHASESARAIPPLLCASATSIHCGLPLACPPRPKDCLLLATLCCERRYYYRYKNSLEEHL